MIKYASLGIAVSKVNISDIVKRAAFLLGFYTLRPKQEDIISAFFCGNNIFGVLPSGYSKTPFFAPPGSI